MKAISNERSAISAGCGVGLLFIACCISLSCSIPNLEPTACIDARTPVREFYSFHFGNEMRFSQQGLKLREKFLTPDFFRKMSTWPNAGDPFTTGNEDFPKAFRVGECDQIATDLTKFQVLLFWKDDVRSEQREIKVEAIKQGGQWLVADVKR